MSAKPVSTQNSNEIQLRIQDLEAMRERVVRDIEGQIAALRRMLPEVPGAARYAAQRRWVKDNGGWRGFMQTGFFNQRGDVDLAALCLTAAGLILAAVVVWGNI